MAEPTFFERYRNWIIGGTAVIGILVIGYLLFFSNRVRKAHSRLRAISTFATRS